MNTLSTLIALIVFVSTPTINNDLVGKWRLDTSNGSVVVEMKADMTWEVDFNGDGAADARGTYRTEGDKLFIQDTEGDCTNAKAEYTYRISGNTLSMTKISDECEGRGGNIGDTLQMTKV